MAIRLKRKCSTLIADGLQTYLASIQERHISNVYLFCFIFSLYSCMQYNYNLQCCVYDLFLLHWDHNLYNFHVREFLFAEGFGFLSTTSPTSSSSNPSPKYGGEGNIVPIVFQNENLIVHGNKSPASENLLQGKENVESVRIVVS